MMKLFYALLAYALCGVAIASDDTVRLIEQLAGIQSYEADFQQVIQDNSGSTLQETSGHMAVKRPEQFYWYSSEPYEQELVSDGEVLWVYDRDLEQAIKKRLDMEVGNTPALLLSGDPGNISSNFAVKRETVGDSAIYYLSPLDESALFETMRVTFKGGLLTEMYLEDGLGQKTVIDFITPLVNQPVRDELFRFEPPENTDIISEI